MNPDTGEMRMFEKGELIPKGWVEWNLHEIVEIKGCKFEVIGINIAENTIKLKGVSGTKIS